MDNYVGKRLDGRYEIQEIVGVGGMSVVYKAYDNIDDRIVAVKILKDEFLANEEFRRRFKNESKAIAVLNHPNIVRVYDVNFGERLQYIVMEYVDGITLKEYIQQQHTINWNDALHFVSQILRALQHAHDKGIVHRDIKPQNIILLQNGNIKVTDFGIARFSRSDTRTMTEKAIGSVHYISPEQARGDMTDEKADIYSVGVVLYEMLTGKVPFESDSAVSVAIMQLQADATPPTVINPSIPKGLEQITMHAMQKLSVDRYQTATEMLLDIDEISRNPNATFDYSYFVDSQPTKFVSDFSETTGELPMAMQTDLDYVDQPEYDAPYDAYEEYEEYPDNREKNKKIIAAISVGVLALIAAVVLLVVGLSGGFSKNKITVPDFVGKDYTEMVEMYKNQFVLEPEYVEENYAVNSIIDQDVDKGKKVKINSTIKVKVVKSGETVPMPDVIGKTLDEAKKALAKVSLNNIEIKEIPSEDVKSGQIISTSPEREIQLSVTDKVILYVSSGSGDMATEKLVMPDFSDMMKDDIIIMLKGYGFTNYTFKTENSNLKENMCISQTPKYKAEVTKDTKITVVLSNGIKPTTAPATTMPPATEPNTTEAPATRKAATLVFQPPTISLENGYAKYDVVIAFNGGEEKFTLTMNSDKPYSRTITSTKSGKVEVQVGISELGFSKTITVDFDNPQDGGYPIPIPKPVG